MTLISTCHGEETRKKLTKCGEEKEEPISVLEYNENVGRLISNTSSFDTIFFERHKITKWFIRMFRKLLTDTLLNCVIIYSTNSGHPKIHHFKFRVDLILAVLIEHGGGGERKVKGISFHRQKCVMTS